MRSNKCTAECPALYHVSFFDPTGTKPLEICPSYQDLVKDIHPANAVILAVYPDFGPQYIRGTDNALPQD
jgi:hypothetical protein